MKIKLKDTSCYYFGSSKKAIAYLQNLFENFKNMPKLLDPFLSEEEFSKIVDIFYDIESDRPTSLEEIKNFIRQELTEKRIRKDIFTIRNRLLKEIDYIRLWYITKDIEEVEAKLAVLKGYNNVLDENESTINEISENLKKNRKKKS